MKISQTIAYMRYIKLTLLTLFMFGLIAPSSVFAATGTFSPNKLKYTGETSLRLDAPTVEKGYTLELDSFFRIGILPNSVRENVLVTLKGEHLDVAPPPGTKRISPIMIYDVLNPDVATVYKPIWITLKYMSDSGNEKALYFYDRNKEHWSKLPSRNNLELKRIHAQATLPFSHVAVFEDLNTGQLGKASWYNADHLGVANNDYPFGTMLRITNLANNKAVIVPVVSTGPFVPGRVVDLTKPAFEKIANPATGVIDVKVEHVF